MDSSKKLLEDLQSVISKYRYEPISSGQMLRSAENADEITIFVPEKYKGKNLVIIYQG